MKAEEAGKALERALGDVRTPLTAADAAAKSGLALRDAAQGLHWLTGAGNTHLAKQVSQESHPLPSG